MKLFYLLLLLSIALQSCQKDKNVGEILPNYYVSNGNLIVLKVSDTLESAFEYNLEEKALQNYSLPLNLQTFSELNGSISYLKLGQNSDTILKISSSGVHFYTPSIPKNKLKVISPPVAFEPANFQAMGNQGQMDLESTWGKIAKLEIVKQYRMANPTAKIGIQKVNLQEINVELEILEMKEKHLIFLVK